MNGLRLDLNLVDYLLLALYFATVLGVGFAARRPKPAEDLRGLVYGTADLGVLDAEDRVWYRSPVLLGSIAVFLSVVLYVPFFQGVWSWPRLPSTRQPSGIRLPPGCSTCAASSAACSSSTASSSQ